VLSVLVEEKETIIRYPKDFGVIMFRYRLVVDVNVEALRDFSSPGGEEGSRGFVGGKLEVTFGEELGESREVGINKVFYMFLVSAGC